MDDLNFSEIAIVVLIIFAIGMLVFGVAILSE
jgi:hypothetical protein